MTYRMRISFVVATTMVGMGLATVSKADLKAGMDAYFNGDYAQARVELEKEVEQGNPVARGLLFRIYRDGLGTPKNPKRAYELYLPVAEKGSTSAMVELGDLALAGAVETDSARVAESWYQRAIDKGSVAGYCGLVKVVAHTSGRSSKATETEVARLLQLAAAERRFPGSACANHARKELARLYSSGIGVPTSACLSVKYRGDLVAYGGGESNWAGAEQRRRNPDLQSIILAMLVARYNRPDETIGKETFVKAVLSDYAEPFRSFLMAVLLKHGLGVAQDSIASARLFDEAIAKMKDEQVFGNMTTKQWARSFYDFDFGCLRLAR